MSATAQPRSAPESSARLRPRTATDLDACVRVLSEVHRQDGYPQDWPDLPAAWLTPRRMLAAWVATVERDAVEPGTVERGAVASSAVNGVGGLEIAGHVALSASGPGDSAPALWSRATGRPEAEAALVKRLFVGPAGRGLGAGALLLAQATDEARRRGLHPVLDVVTTGTSAVALYERAGWSLLGTVEQQWEPGRYVPVHCYAAPSP
ncbi:GNAT family N-acetyltransferase [Streptacidiphilus fuscans]|uniref:GNAT family N-acetyltransferase n=1 Tax=Streptacidiphilus fuscans TaxID=2789292 RepID=A0A931B2Y7_9ACTN|nr:GNAT family N-acetyltransferase [Streptacidiphilus fuscans]MBF9069328.1 GNAT family N-acetyltransferase [Streptacidiphilus fuscans]